MIKIALICTFHRSKLELSQLMMKFIRSLLENLDMANPLVKSQFMIFFISKFRLTCLSHFRVKYTMIAVLQLFCLIFVTRPRTWRGGGVLACIFNGFLYLEHKLRGIVFYIRCTSMVSSSTVPATIKNKVLVSDFFFVTGNLL
jgi:hypothetical protein